MKRIQPVLAVLLIILLLLAGCSAQTGHSGGMPQTTTTAASKSDSEYSNESSPTADGKTLERKIIRNASLDLEVNDVLSAYDSLLNWAAQRGGYEIRRNQQKSNGFITIDAQIKISPDHLDAFLLYAAELGEVINTQISTEDITDSYYDAETRLRSMEASLERYYDYLEQAGNIEESLSVQQEINRLTVEIESMKGRLKLWDSLMAESVVTIRLRQTSDPVKIKKEINWSMLSFADMGYLMKSGLTGVANVLVNIVQWAAIVLVAAAPFWIVALIVIFLLRRRKKKKTASRQAEIRQSTEDHDATPQN